MAVTPRDVLGHGWPEGMPRTGTSDRAGQARAWAPPIPVQLCGPPDGTERRVDSADWARTHVPAPGFWHRLAERLVSPVARLLGF